jgi:hypothetical protein
MWQQIDADRWTHEQPDGTLNYLYAAGGGRLLELHVDPGVAATLHEYAGAAASSTQPLADAAFRRTTERPDLAAAGADVVWRVLARAGG